MWRILLIGFGGAIGAVARYALTDLLHSATGWTFPIGTLVVNVVGCYAIGYLSTLFHGPTLVHEHVQLALLVGVLGGFTTFSAFGWGTFVMMRDGQLGPALANVLLSVGLGLVAVWAGVATAR